MRVDRVIYTITTAALIPGPGLVDPQRTVEGLYIYPTFIWCLRSALSANRGMQRCVFSPRIDLRLRRQCSPLLDGLLAKRILAASTCNHVQAKDVCLTTWASPKTGALKGPHAAQVQPFLYDYTTLPRRILQRGNPHMGLQPSAMQHEA